MRKEYWEILKKLADKMSGNTIAEFYKTDRNYNNSWEQLEDAEKRFNELNLSENELRIIDELLAVREEIDTNNNVLAYMAGFMDCLTFLSESNQLEL